MSFINYAVMLNRLDKKRHSQYYWRKISWMPAHDKNQIRYRKLYQLNRMEESSMKLQKAVMLMLLLGLCFLYSPANVQAADVKDPVLTVLNPLGTPPPIKLLPMAPRLDTIKGKTIYIVNDGYPGSNILLGELKAVMEERHPDTEFIYRDKPGGMGGRVQELWDEIDEKGDAMILALGH